MELFTVMIFEFFRGLKISGKIFSRRYELSRGSRESILGVVVCKFILLVFSGGDSLLFLFLYILFYIFTFFCFSDSVLDDSLLFCFLKA